MIVQPDDWKRQPFAEVTPIPFRTSFSAEEFERIKAGHLPADMDDKWFIYFVEPSLFMHRSWTGKAIYRVDFEPASDGMQVSQAVGNIEAMPDWEAEYHAKLVDVLIGNILLHKGIPFPVPADSVESAPGVFQHHVAGTGQPQVKIMIRRPWWRFWRR